MSLDLVVLGNLLVDDVVLPDGRTRMGEPGGAVLYAALGARLWGLDVGVASVCGSDYPAWALEALAARGVDLRGVKRLDGPNLRTWLLYEGARRRVVHRLEGPTHTEVSPAPGDVPLSWLDARAFHLAPMPFEVQAALVARLAGSEAALVSFDPYIFLTPETLAEWRRVLPQIDLLLLSEDELEVGASEAERRAALHELAGGRLRWVAEKCGARGGVLHDLPAGRSTPWPPRATRVVDPTGAGDAFAAGLIAGLLRDEPLERALGRAVVGASFVLEDWGPASLLAAGPEAAEARLREWFPA